MRGPQQVKMYLIQVLIYSCIYMLETDKKFNKIGIYSVLYGDILFWNIDIKKSKVIDFLDYIIKI